MVLLQTIYPCETFSSAVALVDLALCYHVLCTHVLKNAKSTVEYGGFERCEPIFSCILK